jgi:hypothetical protein
MWLRFPPVLLLAVMTAAACDSETPLSTETPTAPVTDHFSGTLTINGARRHLFSTAGRGTVTATLTSVDPDTAIIGVSIGTWNGVNCQVILPNDQATQGTTVTGSASGVATLCLRVYDAEGSLTGPVAYSVDVTHP